MTARFIRNDQGQRTIMHIARDPEAITAADVEAWRAYWGARSPDARDTCTVGLRDLRFCRVGEVLTHTNVGDWYRLLAALLCGTLDAELAPCTRRGSGSPSDVRCVHRARVDWSAVEPREWAALERAGLPRRLSLRLQTGETDDTDEALTPAQEAARALAAALPTGNLTERMDAANALVREAMVDVALAQTGGNRRDAGEILGVAATRVSEAIGRSEYLTKRWPAGPRGPRPETDE